MCAQLCYDIDIITYKISVWMGTLEDKQFQHTYGI